MTAARGGGNGRCGHEFLSVFTLVREWLAGQDSNLQPSGSKPDALPLNYPPSTQLFSERIELLFQRRDAVCQTTGEGFVVRPVIPLGAARQTFRVHELQPITHRRGVVNNETFCHRDCVLGSKTRGQVVTNPSSQPLQQLELRY